MIMYDKIEKLKINFFVFNESNSLYRTNKPVTVLKNLILSFVLKIKKKSFAYYPF